MRSVFRFLPFAMVACSTPGAAPPVTTDASAEAAVDAPADDCARYAAASCDYGFRCGWFVRAKYPGAGSCIVDLTQKCRESLSLPGLVDPGNHEPCASALSTATCGTPVTACAPRPGTLPNGSACTLSEQCATANCQIDGSSCGTCKPVPVEGTACRDWYECGDATGSLYCNLDTLRCTKRVGLAEECVYAGCASGLSCVSGACVADAMQGQSCPTPGTPNNPNCTAGLACVAGTCTKYQVVGVGEECDEARQCRGDARCISGKCVATKALGESCTKLTDCAWWATCSGGKCVEGFSVCSR